MEEDKDLIASLGLDIQNLFATQGMVCAQKFVEVLATLKEEAVNTPTKATIVDNFAMWGTTTAPEVKTPLLVDNAGAIYSLISFLSTAADDSVPGEKEYKGKGYVAQKLADMLSTVGMMDQTQALVKTFAPFAYNAAEEILSKKVTFEVKPMMQSFDTNPGTTHVEVIIKLIKTIPYSGTVSIDNAIPVLASILLDATLPAKLKTEARTTFNQQSNVNKEHVLKSGNEIMALIEAGGNEALLMMYVQHAELYTNAPAAVHKNLDIFLKQSFQMYCSLYSNIGRLHPRVLLPHVDYFITQMSSFPTMGSLVLMIFESIAGVAPEEFYPFLEKVRPLASNVQNGEMFYAKIVGKLSSATVPANAPDNCLHLLTELLTNHKEGGCVAVIFNEIANVMVNLSDKKALIAALPLLAKHRGTNEVVYTSIDDFANGRSLTVISAKVDELDKKVNALNNKVAETCSNLSDVIAYVDANMADMKDFLAEVIKKLPQPKRLQIDGTLRKALVLVFECSRTGLEFGIVSHEWSKWLKIGFSLVKAGQAVIDLGMGNPLGILKKGVECVQEIYTAYKTNDDDEFNTYITQPFLTSAEQDQLLIKLRDQNFFDKFAYDAQTHGWYLLHPEEDGMEVYAADKSSGMLGSAYGALKTAVGIAAEFVPMAESIKSGMENAESGVSSVKEALSSKKNNEGSESDEARNPINSNGTSNKVAPAPSPAINNSANRATNVGPRAAALKETFSGATNASAEDKLQQANALVAANRKIEDLESRMSALEKQVTALANQPKSGGCCTIC